MSTLFIMHKCEIIYYSLCIGYSILKSKMFALPLMLHPMDIYLQMTFSITPLEFLDHLVDSDQSQMFQRLPAGSFCKKSALITIVYNK